MKTRDFKRRSRSPSLERSCVQSGTYVLAEQRDLFAKIEHWPKFVDRCLAFRHLLFRRGEFQPSRQSLLSGGSPSGAYQLKERPAAEDVEIGRVGMFGIEEPIARLDRVPPISRPAGPGRGRRMRWLSEPMLPSERCAHE